MLARAGIRPPVHGFADARPPFEPGCPVVLKGLAEELWHKSELGGVKFLAYDEAAVAAEAAQMQARVAAAGRRWIGALVCERVQVARADGLPSEGFVSLFRHETGWIALLGFGGLQAEALAGIAPVLRWPVALMSPSSALEELAGHLLGKIWLGRLRGLEPLTTQDSLLEFLTALWRLAGIAEEEGACLIELNPVSLGRESNVFLVGGAHLVVEEPPEVVIEQIVDAKARVTARAFAMPEKEWRVPAEPPGPVLRVVPTGGDDE
jgi:hypothetical protein